MEILENVYLSGFCTYRTGGRARYLAKPKNAGELKSALEFARSKSIPYEIIGAGSNLLFSDAGVDALVICMVDFEHFIKQDGLVFTVGAGVMLNELVSRACEGGHSGLERLVGIPGSVGGAVMMNAGAFGAEIKDVVRRINVMELADGSFEIHLIDASEAKFAYRTADGLAGKVVLGAELVLNQGDKSAINEVRQKLLKDRTTKQPLGLPSCGSVFRNPNSKYGVSAAELIERTKLKGACLGGAQVSLKHANFIVNTGGAKSSDIYSLIEQVKDLVYVESGILLAEEVRYVGNF
ncbi:UDP-N-acetylmuramate dehydrogenase [Deferribacterales bacterium RsTz2092]|nr:UDP-N-acetylenolpyruvoylglucosamine reductase [Deferribacterales bacterium]